MIISLSRRDRTRESVWQMSCSTQIAMKIRSVLCWQRSKRDSTRWRRLLVTSSNSLSDTTSPAWRQNSIICLRNSISRRKSLKNQAFQASSRERCICSKIKSRILLLRISRNFLQQTRNRWSQLVVRLKNSQLLSWNHSKRSARYLYNNATATIFFS